jgi:hypothetical protein
VYLLQCILTIDARYDLPIPFVAQQQSQKLPLAGVILDMKYCFAHPLQSTDLNKPIYASSGGVRE